MPNWSTIFAYDTVKIVTIRDWRLGLAHYLFMLGIVVYTVVWIILLQQRYLKLENPVGSMRLNLMQAYDPLPLDQMPYCWNSTHQYLNGFPIYECIYWDEYFVTYPSVEEYSLFATTRVTVSNQTLNCSLFQSGCYFDDASPEATYYVADIEDFTLLIDHTMSCPTLGIQRNAQSLSGYMLDYEGNKVLGLDGENVNNTIGVPGQADIVTLEILLKAAGISDLDVASETNPAISARQDGIILLVYITYSNTFSYDLSNIRYTYQLFQVKNTKFKALESLFNPMNPSERMIFNRHGIRFIFLQVGELGAFDFQTMLLSFVSGIGLMTVSTMVVDVVFLRILPQRKTFKAYKYQVTKEVFPSMPPDDERNPLNSPNPTNSASV
eukprot:TRINITY_DN1171_c0_g2_i2.p1 TRINITY_DN1171_c0_g2~~TRINITY_DN1171_c0_g2_i2.p1  ORF type:complete len:381 (-),score=42.48 TRINITY_DN1171_c0_g2_i2:41-1183(-)